MKLYLRRFSGLTTEQLYEILTLRNKVFVVEQKSIYLDTDDKDYFSFHFFLKEEGEGVIGYLRVSPAAADFSSVVLGRFCLAPNYRDRKLGRDLFQFALDQIQKQWKSNEVYLSAQGYLQDFYLSFGFKPISEIYDLDGIPHIDMKKHIN